MFNNKSKSTDKLVEKSRKVTELFTKAIADYESINVEIAASITEKEEAIKQAQAEKDQLEKVQASNAKVVGNLKKIFE